MMNDDDNSSGFFDAEIEQPEPSVAFGHIEEFYVSPNGYTACSEPTDTERI